MELNEALAITKKYQNVGAPTPDEEFLLTEAYAFLIDFYGDSFDGSVYMYNLGDHYLRRGEYGLARKYLERCAALDNTVACMPLGMIWYYGLAGETDYAKAFACFEKTKNFPLAKLMLAEMYQKGRGTARDESLRRQYVRDAFEQVWDSPVPNNKGEAFCKYAELLLEDAPDGSRDKEAALLLLRAEQAQQEQMMAYADERDHAVMKEIKLLLYQLDPELEVLNIFDLYWALSKPATILFLLPEMDGAEFGDPGNVFPEETHLVSSHDNGTALEILFDDKWYRDIDHFFRHATIDGMRMAELSYLLTDFQYVEGRL